MTTRACVVFPIYFTLSDEQESRYSKLSDDHKREFLFDLAGEYLQTTSVEPTIEYVETDNSDQE